MGYRTPPISSSTLWAFGARNGAHAPLRVDFGILPDLPVDHRVQRRGLEVFYRRGLVDLDRGLRPAAAAPRLRRLRKAERPDNRDRRARVRIVFFMESSCVLVTLLEDVLAEQVQIVVPLGGVVGIPVHMPDMRHAILFEVFVDALADADQAVLVAASEPQQLQLLWRPPDRAGARRRLLVFGAEEKPPTQANVSM